MYLPSASERVAERLCLAWVAWMVHARPHARTHARATGRSFVRSFVPSPLILLSSTN
jgi:hypothetical protein